MTRRHQLEVQERVRERREREDSAPRLKNRVAGLVSLSIEIDDHFSSQTVGSTRYIRHVVVERSPALFQIPCSDTACEGGGHDLTAEIMRALLAGAKEFSGEDVCSGWRGGDRCVRVLHYVGHATYLHDALASQDDRPE